MTAFTIHEYGFWSQGEVAILTFSWAAERIWPIFPLCSAGVWCRWHRKEEDSPHGARLYFPGMAMLIFPFPRMPAELFLSPKKMESFSLLALGQCLLSTWNKRGRDAVWLPRSGHKRWYSFYLALSWDTPCLNPDCMGSNTSSLGPHVGVPAQPHGGPSQWPVLTIRFRSDSSAFREKISLPLPTQITNLWAK